MAMNNIPLMWTIKPKTL